MNQFFQSIKKILNSLYNRDGEKDDDKKLNNNKKSKKKVTDEEGAKEPINNDASSGSNDASTSTSPNPNDGSSSTNDGTNPNVKTSAPKHDDHGIIHHFIWGGGSSNGGDSSNSGWTSYFNSPIDRFVKNLKTFTNVVLDQRGLNGFIAKIIGFIGPTTIVLPFFYNSWMPRIGLFSMFVREPHDFQIGVSVRPYTTFHNYGTLVMEYVYIKYLFHAQVGWLQYKCMYIFDKFKEINDSLGLFFIDNIYLRDTFYVIQRFSHSGLGLKSLLKREIINKLV